jgi:methyltransferase
LFATGRYWTHRIITLESEPVVRRGPYKYIRHPNYVITLIETMLLPLAFGAWGLGLIMTAIWAAVLHYKILLEDSALAKRREATKNTAAS